MKAKKTTKKIVRRFFAKSTTQGLGVEAVKEKNITRLAQSGILEIFIIENKAAWDHQEWLSLCEEISNSEYYPVDFDKVGLLLEKEKAAYLESQSAFVMK